MKPTTASTYIRHHSPKIDSPYLIFGSLYFPSQVTCSFVTFHSLLIQKLPPYDLNIIYRIHIGLFCKSKREKALNLNLIMKKKLKNTKQIIGLTSKKMNLYISLSHGCKMNNAFVKTRHKLHKAKIKKPIYILGEAL